MFVPSPAAAALQGEGEQCLLVSSPPRWGRCPECHCPREHLEDVLCSKWMEWDSDCEENQSSLPSAQHTLLFGGINCTVGIWCRWVQLISPAQCHSDRKWVPRRWSLFCGLSLFPLDPSYKTKVPGRCTVWSSECTGQCCGTDSPRLPPELLVCKAQTLHSAAAMHWSCSQSLAPCPCSPRVPTPPLRGSWIWTLWVSRE